MCYCKCTSIPQFLVRNGLFPTAPKAPRMAVSIALLDLYQAMFERSCDAINALALALQTYYEQRGFRLLNNKVHPAI
jgi:hypothetical protein